MDLLALSVKFSLDKKEYEQGLDDCESKAYKTGQAIGTGMKGIGSAVAGAIGGLAKITAAGITATTGAAIAITKKAISEYAEYQQLLGGVQKLYGTAGMSVEQYAESVGKSVDEVKTKYDELTRAQNMVLENAQQAYRTAGMSTSKYMETATSFSAALINSLEGDTVKAAELTDVAMRAISDNYNTFGGDMQNIQNAFQGFAKQNYTMLDNLKLGYGGSAAGMVELIKDSGILGEAAEELTNKNLNEKVSFDQIVEAIQIVQEKQGIAGTTAREAATTISGSLGMLKGAWENLIAGLADPDADISKLINNVVQSIVGYTDEAGKHVNGFLDNIIPTIKQATQGLVQLVAEAIPALAKELPDILQDTLPLLIQAGIDLFNGLIDALPTVMKVLFDQLPTIIEAIIDAVVKLLPMIIELGFTLLEALATGLLEALPDIMPKITQLIEDLVAMFSRPDSLVKFLNAAVEIIVTLAKGLIDAIPTLIPAIVDVVLAIVDFLTDPNNLTMIIETGIELLMALVNGLIEALPRLIEALPVIVETLVEVLLDNLPLLIDATIKIVMAIAQCILENLPLLIAAAIEIIFALISGIVEALPQLLHTVMELITQVIATFIKMLPKFVENGIKIVGAVIEGIVKMFGSIVKAAIGLIEEFIKGIADRFVTLIETGKEVVNSVKNGIMDKIEDAKQWGKDLIDNFINGLKEKWENLKNTVKDIANSIKDILGFSEPKEGPLSNFHTYAPDMMQLFAKGITDNKKMLLDTVADAFNFGDMIVGPSTNLGNAQTGVGASVYNINIYQPMKSATDVAKAIREEQQYGLIGGGSLAY